MNQTCVYMLKRLRQFRSLPQKDRKLLLRIAFILPFIEIVLRLAGFNRLVWFLNRFAKAENTVSNPHEEVERHRLMMFLLHKQFPFSGRCLARALTLWIFLERKGIKTNLRFGMKKEDEKLAAHAWVEYKEKPLTIDPEVHEHYTVFAEPILQKAMRL